MAEYIDRLTSALSDRYAIERELGSGGMATVYLARDLKHDRRVAVKVLRPELSASLGGERFLREIKLTARLNHPHILPLLDSGEAGGFLFYTMPFAEGESLRQRLHRERQLPVDEAVTIAKEVADALSYAHGQGVIHRDIKPENIVVESGHAVVLDFGIARAISAAGGERLTATGVALGTTVYMSPEQAAGGTEIDGRSDLYSLGCVLFEMLAGRPPFVGVTSSSIVMQHLTEEPVAVTTIRAAVPKPVADALTRVLAKTPADRFSRASQFAEALTQHAPATAPILVSKSGASRVPPRLQLTLAVAAVLALSAAFMVFRARQAQTPAVAQHPRTAIAVLPFENLSGAGPNAYFAGGLQDELLTQLSKVAALSVKSRTSVMGYAGPSVPPLKQIARELEVGSLVEATVQVVGDQLRVNVQLIDAATNAHLWAEHYDRKLDDAFAIQSDIARQIVSAVGAALTGEQRQEMAQAPTVNPEAYRLYLEGRDYWTQPGYIRKNHQAAQRRYEEAVTLDPSFAVAHAALSDLHGLIYWTYDRTTERAALERQEADAALRLAPDLPQAHSALGTWHYYVRGDYPRALGEFRIASAGLPNDAEVWQKIGQVNRRMGNATEALVAYEKATGLSPRSANLFKELCVTLLWMHQYPESIAACNRAWNLAPEVGGLPAMLKGQAYMHWHGQLDSLRASLLPQAGNKGLVAAQMVHWERLADSMVRLSKGMPKPEWESATTNLPVAMYAGWGHQLRGDQKAARSAFDSARLRLDSLIRDRSDDARLHAARGLALAGLGRRAEARREAQWLEQSREYREDRFQGVSFAADRARILAQIGDVDAALAEVESLLAKPSQLSVHSLRLDPLFDPIRADPRFQALLTKYAVR